MSFDRCLLCGRSAFISLRPDEFMTRCLRCRASVNNLAPIQIIENHFRGREKRTAYELSTYGCLVSYLKRNFRTVLTSEYRADVEPGSVVDGILYQDVQRLTFADNSLDLITSNGVFEHVPDDIQAFRECYRTLAPGGALIFTVPLHLIPVTRQLAAVTPAGIVHLMYPPEYHGSRQNGAESELAFWHHSINDICGRLKAAGFEQTSIKDVWFAECQRRHAKVVYARKLSEAQPAQERGWGH
jgi:SAM-dependent methyltransferase